MDFQTQLTEATTSQQESENTENIFAGLAWDSHPPSFIDLDHLLVCELDELAKRRN